RARGVRRLPAQEARGRRRAAPDPQHPRRRLRPARAVSLRRRLVLLSAAAVAAAVVVAATATYVVARAQLRGHLDDELRSFSGGVVIVQTQNSKPVPGSVRTQT